MAHGLDSELIKKTRKAAEKMSENLYIIGNEPTLACYRIQEHVHKSGPMIIDKGTEMKRVRRNLQVCCYGVDYTIKELKEMEGSVIHYQNIQELLKNALFMKQQLDYEENVRARVRAKQQVHSPRTAPTTAANRSPFQRFSGSFDIPATIISSSLSGLSSSASSDFKELKSVLSGIKQPSTSSSTSVPKELPQESGASNSVVPHEEEEEDGKRMF